MTPIRDELEAPVPERRLGTGWLSGVLALVLAVIGLGTVLCLRYPAWLTVADARKLYDVGLIRLALHLVLIAAFVLGCLCVALRRRKVLGFAALALVLTATALGGSQTQSAGHGSGDVYLGLDWFLLNLIFSGGLFIPLERLFGRREQDVFRPEWREDLLYFLVSSLFVQGLTYLSTAPALTLVAIAPLEHVRAWVGSQPVVVQVVEIMFLTDLVQYWVHRMFHRIPWLWRFHAVHHSARTMDWLAGSRMHFLEIVVLRGTTVIPMYVLGFAEPALYAYLVFVYLFSTWVHANVRTDLRRTEQWFVTPRFHHWHHGIEKEAIDVNFAVHFPLFDRLFGTHYLPEDGRWPEGYGIAGHPVPPGYAKQFAYPFRRKK